MDSLMVIDPTIALQRIRICLPIFNMTEYNNAGILELIVTHRKHVMKQT